MQDTVKHLPDFIFSNEPVLESEDLFVLLQKLVIAILIGALIGLEREHSKPEEEKVFAGIRTFPIIAILGFVASLISSITSFWIYFAIFLGYASLITASHIFSAKAGRIGGTSEITTLIVFILGSLVYWNLIILAAVIGVIVTLFLTLKFQLHKFVGKISEEDIYATVKLAIITVIILPLLPDETLGPLDILNPRLIWYMVIFISGISFIGYIFIKIFGKNKGLAITGLMGGMVSSTAVTFSLSKKSRINKELSPNFAIGIILASTIMFPRIFIVAFVLNPSLIEDLWIPMLLCTAAGLTASFGLSRSLDEKKESEIDIKNPFELKSAFMFGLIFGVVIFVSKAAEVYFGTGGIYAASALAGITSVDAMVLSLAELSSGSLSREIAVAAIIIAAISNTIIKGIITVFLGSKELQKNTLAGLGIITFVSSFYLAIILFF